jgi:hypothetical protein
VIRNGRKNAFPEHMPRRISDKLPGLPEMDSDYKIPFAGFVDWRKLNLIVPG